MAQSPVISALIAKRGEVAGQIIDLNQRIAEARANLAHIDATLRIFDPKALPSEIRATRVSRHKGWFETGEMTRRILESLRRSPTPVAAEEMVRAAMTDKGLDPEDKRLRQQMIQTFLGTLHRLNRGGKVRKVGNGLGSRWALPLADKDRLLEDMMG
jgi:hypothetical protein